MSLHYVLRDDFVDAVLDCEDISCYPKSSLSSHGESHACNCGDSPGFRFASLDLWASSAWRCAQGLWQSQSPRRPSMQGCAGIAMMMTPVPGMHVAYACQWVRCDSCNGFVEVTGCMVRFVDRSRIGWAHPALKTNFNASLDTFAGGRMELDGVVCCAASLLFTRGLSLSKT